MQEHLRINLQPSKYLSIYLWLLHVLLLVIVLQLPLPDMLILLNMLVILLSAIFYHRKYGHTDWPFRIKTLVLTEGKGRIILRNQQKYGVELKSRHFVSSHLVILRLRVPGKWTTVHLVICRDMVEGQLFRWLKVRARFPV